MRESGRPIFAANWKMNKGPPETAEFVRRFRDRLDPSEERTTVFFPPAVSLGAFREAAAGRPDLELGVQDVHEVESGAHTGAIAARMAAGAGATWGLAGHSERRREFGDDDARVAAKVQRLLEAGLRPVLCVGETLKEREEGALRAVLARQVSAVAPALSRDERSLLVFAYEPVWAIGTGRSASGEDVAEAHEILRAEIAGVAGDELARGTAILYGGSVKPDNTAGLLDAPGVDGVLVGGASLDPESFARICESAGAR
ncbi:MAG: triose-phosphate isomerase [Gemmatimonadota bacterium]